MPIQYWLVVHVGLCIRAKCIYSSCNLALGYPKMKNIRNQERFVIKRHGNSNSIPTPTCAYALHIYVLYTYSAYACNDPDKQYCTLSVPPHGACVLACTWLCRWLCATLVTRVFLFVGILDDGLAVQFFGENKDKKLTIREFQSFHEALRMELLKLEVSSCMECVKYSGALHIY